MFRTPLGPLDRLDLGAVIVFLIAFSLYAMPGFVMGGYSPLTPDEAGNIFFARQLATEGGLTYENGTLSELMSSYGLIRFRPRFMVPLDSHFVPFSFLGYFYVGLISLSVSDQYLLLQNALIGALGILFLYLFLSLLNINRRIALGLSAAFVALPPYWLYSVLLFSNIPASVLFLGALYFYAKGMKGNERTSLAVASLFVGTAVLVRNTFLLFAFVLFVHFLLHTIRHQSLRRNLPVLGPGMLCLGLLIVSSYTLYGGFQIGYLVSPSTETVPIAGTSIRLPGMELNGERILSNFMNYAVYVNPFLAVLGIWGMVLAAVSKRSDRGVLVSFLAVAVIILVFFGTNIFYGYGMRGFSGEFVFLRSSYARFFLPMYLVLALFSGLWLHRFRFRLRRTGPILIAFVFLTSAVAATTFDGPLFTADKMAFFQSLPEEIERAVPPDAVLLSTHADEKLFPSRYTGLLAPFSEGAAEATKLEVLQLLAERPVFVLIDSFDSQAYAEYFSDQGMVAERIPTSSYILVRLKNPDSR
jgi:hypothetical protein